jgi:hypothetical protein
MINIESSEGKNKYNFHISKPGSLPGRIASHGVGRDRDPLQAGRLRLHSIVRSKGRPIDDFCLAVGCIIKNNAQF